MIILNPDFTIIRVNPAMEKLPFVSQWWGESVTRFNMTAVNHVRLVQLGKFSRPANPLRN